MVFVFVLMMGSTLYNPQCGCFFNQFFFSPLSSIWLLEFCGPTLSLDDFVDLKIPLNLNPSLVLSCKPCCPSHEVIVEH